MKKLWKIIKENITVVLAMTTAFFKCSLCRNTAYDLCILDGIF